MKEKLKWLRKEFQMKIFRRIALKSCRTVHVGEAHDCFGELPSNSPRRVVQSILPKLGNMFSRTKTFCFENNVFLTFSLGMHEGVSEGSRSGKG